MAGIPPLVGGRGAELAAQLSLRSLVEAAPDGIVVIDATGAIVLVNAQTESLFGYARDEILGGSIEVLVPESSRGRHPGHRVEYFADPRARGMGSTRDLHGRRKDGTEFPVEISLSPIETEHGVFVSSSIRDVTERRRMEEARFRLAAIVDSSDDAIIGKSLDGLITSWNHGAERIFGYSAAEVTGKPVSLLIPPGVDDNQREILARMRKGERIDHYDTVRRRKDGSLLDVSVTVSPVRDSAGNLVGASKVVRDITARKRSEAALERAKNTAETASRELEAFSYSVAHDLRAPLRGIDGFSLALLEDHGDELDAEGKDYLQRVRASAQIMAQLIDDLLMLSRVTQTELRHEPVDLTSLARAAVARLRAAQPPRELEIVVAEGLTGRGDSRLLGIVFDNLLGNAWKFTRDQPSPRIELDATPGTPHQVYCLRDNGAGFDMAYSSKLFGVFQRLHGASEFEGTGIGLATVQRIIRRHGGRVWAEGAVGQGCTVYFTLANEEQRP
jgi:PAS domain S-box-containing protein